MIYGLGLPDDVLEKVYHRNAERLFAEFKGTGQSAGKAAAKEVGEGSARRARP